MLKLLNVKLNPFTLYVLQNDLNFNRVRWRLEISSVQLQGQRPLSTDLVEMDEMQDVEDVYDYLAAQESIAHGRVQLQVDAMGASALSSLSLEQLLQIEPERRAT